MVAKRDLGMVSVFLRFNIHLNTSALTGLEFPGNFFLKSPSVDDFLSLSRRRSSSRNVPSSEERGETAVRRHVGNSY